MSYLQGWESATERLDAKCGKGWKPGPGGKCVRAKEIKGRGLSRAQSIGLGVTGAALLGAAAGIGTGMKSRAEYDKTVGDFEKKKKASEADYQEQMRKVAEKYQSKR